MDRRPRVLHGNTHKYSLGCGNVYIVINHNDDGKLVELFMYMGKGGECAFAFSESVSRAISQALRAGMDVEKIIKQQSGIKCPNGQWNEGRMVHSCSDAVAQALRKEVGG